MTSVKTIDLFYSACSCTVLSQYGSQDIKRCTLQNVIRSVCLPAVCACMYTFMYVCLSSNPKAQNITIRRLSIYSYVYPSIHLPVYLPLYLLSYTSQLFTSFVTQCSPSPSRSLPLSQPTHPPTYPPTCRTNPFALVPKNTGPRGMKTERSEEERRVDK